MVMVTAEVDLSNSRLANWRESDKSLSFIRSAQLNFRVGYIDQLRRRAPTTAGPTGRYYLLLCGTFI